MCESRGYPITGINRPISIYKIQHNTKDLIAKAPGKKSHKICRPCAAEFYCFKLDLNTSKLVYYKKFKFEACNWTPT